MGNAARKARKRAGAPLERSAKEPTVPYRDAPTRREMRRRDRRAASIGQALVEALITDRRGGIR